MFMPRILIVDDEANIRDVVEYTLKREGYDVESVDGGQKALDRVGKGGVDLVVLDVLMPDLDGLQVCRRLRESGPQPPVIFLSSRDEEVDRILGLELGADDYVCKPFSPRELATRIKVVLRRMQPPSVNDNAGRIQHGRLSILPERHEIQIDGNPVDFTVTEFRLLEILCRSPGRVFTRQQLIDSAHSPDYHVTDRTIDTHVRRIRSKLRSYEVDPIDTVHGVGYRAMS